MELLNGEWHYLTAVVDRAKHEKPIIYMDAAINHGCGWGSGYNDELENVPVGGTFYIGKGLSDYFSGLIDEVRIYSEALPATEIQKHYVQGLNKLLVNQAITQSEYDKRMKEFNQYLVSNRF